MKIQGLGLPPTATAQAAERMDLNRDGRIDPQEARAVHLSTQSAAQLGAPQWADGSTFTRREGPGRGGRLFKTSDVDGDGKLSGSEIQAFAAALSNKVGREVTPQEALAQFDLDGDGQISKQEFRVVRRQMREAELKVADGNGDGTFSGAEIDTLAAQASARRGRPVTREEILARKDLNGDGVVTKEELDAKRLQREARARMTQTQMEQGGVITLGSPNPRIG